MTVFEYIQAHPNTTSGDIARGLNKKTPAVSGAISQLYTTWSRCEIRDVQRCPYLPR